MSTKYNITIPENISEITLRQFLKFEELQEKEIDALSFNRRLISLFTDIPFSETQNLKQSDFDKLTAIIYTALNTEIEFTPRFTMHGIEFGFVPNLDKITFGEYVDISAYGTDKENLHRLMAVLFRPIKNKSGDKYEVLGYNGTDEYCEMMKDMPMNCVNGAMVFFYNLANELETATQRYLTQELQKEMRQPTTSKISGGIQRLKDWLETTFLTFQRLKS